MKLKQFIRKDVLNFQEYKTVASVWDLARKFNKKESEIIKLDQGENFFGVSPNVTKKLGKYQFYNYYPDPEYKDLRKAISKSYKIPFEKIMVGSGSDELIDLLFRMVIEISDEVINFPPTFGMYNVSLKLNRAKVINVKRDKSFNIDINAALKALTKKTKLIVVCSPNNPTGNPTPRDDIIKLLGAGKLVLLDEAYAEYASENNLDLVNQYPNLIILRTFSKWAGLAGLRLGFVVMNEYLISQLMKIKSPFNVNLAAEVAGIAVLKDLKFAKVNIWKLKLERKRLSERLSDIPYLKVFPSQTNFVFAKVLVKDFEDFKKYLLENQTMLRYFESDLVGKSIRITIGQPKVNDKIVKLFKNYPPKFQNIDAIIFDMDGVLIDESESYLLSIEKTVNYLLDGNKTNNSEVLELKKIPGFNDDWDSSYMLLKLKKRNVPKKQFLKVAQLLSKEERNSIEFKKIRDIFQTFYLGSRDFEKNENKKAPFIYNSPLRFKEKLLITKKLLTYLSKKYKLGIATGRPRNEALFALKRFSLEGFFKEDLLVAKEDAKREKPYPYPLLEAKRRMTAENPVYIGDTINDSMAAQKANMPFIFVGTEKIGERQVNNVNQIEEII